MLFWTPHFSVLDSTFFVLDSTFLLDSMLKIDPAILVSAVTVQRVIVIYVFVYMSCVRG